MGRNLRGVAGAVAGLALAGVAYGCLLVVVVYEWVQRRGWRRRYWTCDGASACEHWYRWTARLCHWRRRRSAGWSL